MVTFEYHKRDSCGILTLLLHVFDNETTSTWYPVICKWTVETKVKANKQIKKKSKGNTQTVVHLLDLRS